MAVQVLRAAFSLRYVTTHGGGDCLSTHPHMSTVRSVGMCGCEYKHTHTHKGMMQQVSLAIFVEILIQPGLEGLIQT